MTVDRTFIYRITDQRYEAEVFSGKGGFYAAGRWHERGRRVVYAALTSSLALLEWRVHTRALPLERTFILVEASVPTAELIHLDLSNLPANWRQTPPPPSTRQLGEAFLEDGSALGLIVPSAINSLESNVLVNPRHAAAAGIRTHRIEVLEPDERLF